MNVNHQNLLNLSQIMHVDMDSFFASVSQQADPFLQGRPIVVSGKPGTRTVVAAASKEAKRFGIKSGMAVWEAAKLCPKILIVPGKPQCYKKVHQQVFEILCRYTPEIEVFSIDEWFLDVTKTARRFGGVFVIAKEIKQRLWEVVGDITTCSIGIGCNKSLAKIASDLDKPDGLVDLRGLQGYKDLESLGVTLKDICGIGFRLEKRLLDLGIFNIKGLANCPEEFLVRQFGSRGDQLFRWARGADNTSLTPFYREPEERSFGHSYTLPVDTLRISVLKAVLLTLSEKVAWRMRQKGFFARTIHLWVRNAEFKHWGKQKTLVEDINDGYQIYREAWQIFENLKIEGRVRALGVSVSNLGRNKQLPLLPNDRKMRFSQTQNQEMLTSAIDKINRKHGQQTLFRASQLQTNLIERTGYFARP